MVLDTSNCFLICYDSLRELTRQSLWPRVLVYRGKSGLRRVECQVTPGKRELMESATENRPPMILLNTGKGEKVR